MSDFRLAGSLLDLGDTDEHDFFFKDGVYYNTNHERISGDDLGRWALWLNSPWSYDHAKFLVEANCKDAYSGIEKGEPIWRCIYTCVGYDAATATLVGYGNTPDAALLNCTSELKSIQEKYNPDDDAV